MSKFRSGLRACTVALLAMTSAACGPTDTQQASANTALNSTEATSVPRYQGQIDVFRTQLVIVPSSVANWVFQDTRKGISSICKRENTSLFISLYFVKTYTFLSIPHPSVFWSAPDGRM